jgi:hypothetical protein
MLVAAGCSRAPRNAAELAKALPEAFTGELHIEGETQPHHIRLEARELSVRSEHVLEFNRVDYQLKDGQDDPGAEGEARIRGTITAPGLEVRLEMPGTGFSEDVVRPETFTGKLSGDLQSLDAEWSNGLGQKAHLKLQAASK